MRKFTLILMVLLVFCTLGLAKTKITFWYAISGVSGEAVKALIDRFQAENPDIVVEAIYSGKYADTAQKITAALAANALPNGGIIPAGPIFTGPRGNYAILDYMLKDPTFDMSDFYEGMWDYSKYKGKICAVPYNISTPVLYYNKELMEKAGLDPTKPPTTWQELLEYSKKITQDTNSDGIPDIWGLNMADTAWIFKSFLLQNENDIVQAVPQKDDYEIIPLFDRPSALETAEYWKQLIDEKAMPMGLHSLAEKQFLGNTLGFYLGTSARIGTWTGNTSFDFGVGYLPKGKRLGIPIGGAVLVLFPAPKDQMDATYQLIKWLTQPDKVAEFSMKTGYIPIRKSSLALPEMKAFFETNPFYKTAFEQSEYAFSYWHFDAMGTMDGLITEVLEKIERGVSSPKEGMRWLQETTIEEIEASL
ncbi:MAG TPA: ABC transporter substrate-binding protein [Thermotogota bacterium]|nr:ABC transporter substrate-binding protein [Thermotogota bacterium]NLH19035.1 ABC transporter substrate-binding protein [Thermotogaceae bacterium]OQC32896.1 MAG: sn-glycerol-3-phosphate-binding periplasmic protein UgpB precursor [Thermotogota bacterium ADurb.Bin062]HNW47415.1 ABC transporter substrate-binding protein [Thermotogota bacterium]HNY82429.1 ABC transporter substrate-binding protein [Thermotogota bacterium]